MVVPWLIFDPGFPECRREIDSRAACSYQLSQFSEQGLDEQGFAVPGIIDIGNLLGTGSFEPPIYGMSEPELRSNPVTGADAIVTTLYQYRPSLLRQFLDTTQFKYTHFFDEKSYSEDKKRRLHFSIVRTGNHVQAGFFEGHTPDEETSGTQWVSGVRYTITKNNVWRQEHMEYPGIDPSKKSTIKCEESDDRMARLSFEQWAGHVMAAAIKQRRWSKQPGANIEIKSNPRE